MIFFVHFADSFESEGNTFVIFHEENLPVSSFTQRFHVS